MLDTRYLQQRKYVIGMKNIIVMMTTLQACLKRRVEKLSFYNGGKQNG